MKVMFDLCAFSDLVERRAFDDSSASARKGTAYASLTFLEELASLRKKDEQKFTAILDLYASLTPGRIMLPWNELVRREIETGRPVIAEGVLLPSEDHQEAINLLRKGSLSVDAIGEEVAEKKQRYEDGMNKAAESVKEELCVRGHSTSDIKKGFAEWLRFAPQYWQDWGELFPRPSIDYTILPHVKAHLGFLFVKVYQTMNQKRTHKASDLYDQGYYVESTTLGNLATCDGDLIRTIKLVPDNTVMVHDVRTWI